MIDAGWNSIQHHGLRGGPDMGNFSKIITTQCIKSQPLIVFYAVLFVRTTPLSNKIHCSTVITNILAIDIPHIALIRGRIITMTPHERHVVSNYRLFDCLAAYADQTNIKVRVLCEGNSTVNGEFPAQRGSNAEKVSIWWRHLDSWVPCASWKYELYSTPVTAMLLLISRCTGP